MLLQIGTFLRLNLVSLCLAGPCVFGNVVAAQTVQQVVPAAEGLVLTGTVTGDQTVSYAVQAAAGQRLSVDLSSTNGGLTFNILPQGSDSALFIGATSGNVADVPVSAAGTYVVQVALVRAAARRGESASYTLGIGLGGADFADSLAGGPDWWAVSGVTSGALNIRSGPGTRYAAVGKAQNGEVMQNLGCRMSGQTRWCRVRVDGSGVQGWAAGTFLAETAAPQAATVPAGGPKGEGAAFDATGEISCAPAAGQDMRPCPFGVVRSGPGNAGVWIALGGGAERQILFEGGKPVATNVAAALEYDDAGGVFLVRIGDERYDIPEAVVNGG